ncbi:MAG TPA: FGGY family carbohydrate kinase [Candidatus Limnocylindrales bacterium]|nr:FGGY family carbohydrate kinase [Candidatus Limnocylindrales bacterium]
MTSRGEVLVAIDVGTSGARAAAYDFGGRPVDEVRRPYPTDLGPDGRAEQDANRWRSASLSALAGLVRNLGPRSPIRAISLTGQCPSVVPLDDHDRPLRPGLIYRDNRAVAEALAIRRQFGDRLIHDRTGHLPAAFHVAAKVLWLRANEPEAFAATRRFVEPSDFVALALTGENVTDWTIATASALFNVRERRWDDVVLDGLDLEPDLFPVAHPSWAVVGELRPAVVRRLGLARSVPVVIGGGDSLACAFGAGVVAPGPISEMAGSSTCLNSVVPEPLADLEVTNYPNLLPGDGYFTEVGINTSGEAVDWLAALAYGGRSGRPTGADYARIDAEAGAVPAGADGLLVVPVLGDGERDDPGLRGAAVGLSLRHGRAALARAVLEGVAFGIRARIETLAVAGSAATELRVSGGDSRLGTWNQIKADVLGIPIIRVPGDATSAGAALLAGLGAGIYRDAAEAVAVGSRAERPIEPDPAVHQRYGELYRGYRDLVASRAIHTGGAVG